MAADPLAEPQPVDAATRDAFRTRGHALVRRLAAPEVLAPLRPVIEEAALAHAVDKRPLAERDTYGRAFLQSFNLWRVDPRIQRFVFAARFASVAAGLLGVEGVRLYHDQALFKEPHGGHTPWHQDQYYWPLEGGATVTMWMPLVDLPAEIGSMHFATGSHLLGDLCREAISDASERRLAEWIDQSGVPVETYGALAAGDATFHHGWTVHSAGPNPSELLRSVMTVIYLADGTRVAPVANPHQEFDRKVWLGGKAPGALVAGELNPRLWPAMPPASSDPAPTKTA